MTALNSDVSTSPAKGLSSILQGVFSGTYWYLLLRYTLEGYGRADETHRPVVGVRYEIGVKQGKRGSFPSEKLRFSPLFARAVRKRLAVLDKGLRKDLIHSAHRYYPEFILYVFG